MSGADQRRHYVVQVTSFYPPHLGGVENIAQALSELLAERHEVRVMTTTCGSGNAPMRERKAGVQVRRFAGFMVAHTPVSLGLALGLLTIRRRSIVHVHVAQAFLPEVVLLTSLLQRRPYIAHFHLDVDPTGRFGWLLPMYKRWILGPFLRRAAAVIALSEEQASFLTSQYGVAHGRITVIPNGVNPCFYRPDSCAPEPIPQARALRLLFVGRLDVQKNVARLIDAITHVSSRVELVIVGDGELREEISGQIDRLGLTDVRLVGAEGGFELVKWYRWADALVLPSDKEGMPLVLLEAMAAGLAVIATDVPGTRDLVDRVGLLTDPNPESLGAAIERVAADPGLLSKLSMLSSIRAVDFQWSPRVAELERLYDSVAVR